MQSTDVVSGTQATAAQFNNLRADVSAAIRKQCSGRLTLTTGVPVTTADVTAATTVFFTPFNGDIVSLYSGSEWQNFTLTELSIALTNNQSGTYTNSTGVLSGLTSTAQLTVGMTVTKTAGAGILGTTPTIASIDSATQVTLTPTGGTTGAITVDFKIPASTCVDIVLYNNAGTLRLEFGALWSSGTARFGSGTYATLLPTQNGVKVKSTNGTTVDATRRYLGTIMTTSTAGQTESSKTKRLVWNYYNRRKRELSKIESTSHTYASTIRVWNGDATQKLEFVLGVAEEPLEANLYTDMTAATFCYVSWGLDSQSVAYATGPVIYGAHQLSLARWGLVTAGIGYHYLSPLETSSGTSTFAMCDYSAVING